MQYPTIKKLFLLDGLGAMLSAVLLGIVLVQFEAFFGIPKPTLYLLASLPCLFAIYDFYCYFKIDRNLKKFLTAIAMTNILYCFLSIGLAMYHYQVITSWGWAYILIEVIIVSSLAFAELRVANRKIHI